MAASPSPARLRIIGKKHMLVSRPDQGRQANTPLGVAGTGFRPNLYDAIIFVLVVGVLGQVWRRACALSRISAEARRPPYPAGSF